MCPLVLTIRRTIFYFVANTPIIRACPGVLDVSVKCYNVAYIFIHVSHYSVVQLISVVG